MDVVFQLVRLSLCLVCLSLVSSVLKHFIQMNSIIQSFLMHGFVTEQGGKSALESARF